MREKREKEMERQKRAIGSVFLSLFYLVEKFFFELLSLIGNGGKASLRAKVVEFSKGKLKNFVRIFGL